MVPIPFTFIIEHLLDRKGFHLFAKHRKLALIVFTINLTYVSAICNLSWFLIKILSYKVEVVASVITYFLFVI